MRYLHTMIRIKDIDESLAFYCDALGMREMHRMESEQGRFTLIFLAAPEDKRSAAENKAPLLELTYNWDPEDYGEGRNFGHLAFEVDDIYATCEKIGLLLVSPSTAHHATDTWPLCAHLDNISVELLQKRRGSSLKKNLGARWRIREVGEELVIKGQ